MLTTAEMTVHTLLAEARLRNPRSRGPSTPMPGKSAVTIPLAPSSGTPLTDLLVHRVSIRDLAGPISWEELSRVLNPLITTGWNGLGRWAVPTTGGLTAFRLLCVANAVTGLAADAYWVDPSERSLQATDLNNEAIQNVLNKCCDFLGLPASGPPPAVLFLCIANWARLGNLYENAALASSLWDAGTMVSHLYLAGTEAGVDCCACSAVFHGDDLVVPLGLDPEQWGHVATFGIGRAELPVK